MIAVAPGPASTTACLYSGWAPGLVGGDEGGAHPGAGRCRRRPAPRRAPAGVRSHPPPAQGGRRPPGRTPASRVSTPDVPADVTAGVAALGDHGVGAGILRGTRLGDGSHLPADEGTRLVRDADEPGSGWLQKKSTNRTLAAAAATTSGSRSADQEVHRHRGPSVRAVMPSRSLTSDTAATCRSTSASPRPCLGDGHHQVGGSRPNPSAPAGSATGIPPTTSTAPGASSGP